MPALHPLKRRSFLRVAFTALGALALPHAPAASQIHEKPSALSDAEVERLRDSADKPTERLLVFVDMLNQRADRIDTLASGTRHAGREEDLHEIMEQITSILDDLSDNLDDWDKRHRDLRKPLPKLLAATERWATALRTPPDHPEYSVQRKLALESLDDVHQTTAKLIDEQKQYFKDHPPGKSPAASTPG